MNLARVLDVALPDVPPLRQRQGFPRMHPKHVAREHVERDGPLMMVLVPDGPNCFFRFNPLQYKLATKFDGTRSYEQVAHAFQAETGVVLDPKSVEEFAESLEKMDFWYKTPQEQSILLCEQLIEQRQKKIKKKHNFGDMSVIELVYFDPDSYLRWAHQKLSFIYTPWFTAWSFLMLAVMLGLLGARWNEVWSDSVKFYNFTDKNIWDVVEFFAIFLLLGAFHETAHGMTCIHFGGASHRMGVFLMYLVPGVFCEVQEVYVYGGRRARMLTVAAGVWSEILLCQYFTILWWFTPPGTFIHDFCYKLILSGGIFCVLINWNPLAKMDGYYLFCELFRFWDLKGLSSSYLSAWVRKNIFRMPATVPALPPLRRLGFAAYAMLSGVYCYSLMLFFVRILYKVAYHFTPQWAFLPATALAFVIFRSRINKLGQFMKELYLDRKEWLQQHRTPILAGAIAVFILLITPIRREYVEEPFVLEPITRAVIRAEVPGEVSSILVQEGQRVQAGEPVAMLRDLQIESKAAAAQADFQVAASRANDAQLNYTDFGRAEQHRIETGKVNQITQEEARKLTISSPISGLVTSPRPRDLLGSYIAAGTVIAEVADTSSMRARVYVSETELNKLHHIHSATLRANSMWKQMDGKFVGISPAARQVAPGLMSAAEYTGLHAPAYFTVDLIVQDDGAGLLSGMSGVAKIYGERRSLAGSMLRPVVESLARKLW
jgi:putative peptide zinc metalloprotease protein